MEKWLKQYRFDKNRDKDMNYEANGATIDEKI